jgi:hypothetical protein
MIAMRRSNILLMRDPTLAVDLAAEAARLIDGRSVGRLRASIARQQALAAIADHDRASFVRHAARALDVAYTEPVADDHAVYATRAYVASEVASGFVTFGEPAKAIELLLEHHNSWQTTNSVTTPLRARASCARSSLCTTTIRHCIISMALPVHTWLRRRIEPAANCDSVAG